MCASKVTAGTSVREGERSRVSTNLLAGLGRRSCSPVWVIQSRFAAVELAFLGFCSFLPPPRHRPQVGPRSPPTNPASASRPPIGRTPHCCQWPPTSKCDELASSRLHDAKSPPAPHLLATASSPVHRPSGSLFTITPTVWGPVRTGYFHSPQFLGSSRNCLLPLSVSTITPHVRLSTGDSSSSYCHGLLSMCVCATVIKWLKLCFVCSEVFRLFFFI